MCGRRPSRPVAEALAAPRVALLALLALLAFLRGCDGSLRFLTRSDTVVGCLVEVGGVIKGRGGAKREKASEAMARTMTSLVCSTCVTCRFTTSWS